jgi:hypothetical protein
VLARRDDGLYVSGPREPLDLRRRYSVAANELFATGAAFPAGAGARPVGSEVQALAWYAERTFTASSQVGNRRVTATP